MLATLAGERTTAFPDVPTADEQGMKDFDISAWNAIFLPKSATPAMVAKLNAAVSKALDNPALRKRLDDIGLDSGRAGAADAGVSSEVRRRAKSRSGPSR